jgi:hypothetical protein
MTYPCFVKSFFFRDININSEKEAKMGELSYYGDNNLFGSIVTNNMGLASLMIVTIIVMLCGWFFSQRKTKALLPLGRLGFPFIRDTLEFMTTLRNNIFNSCVAKYREVHQYTNMI